MTIRMLPTFYFKPVSFFLWINRAVYLGIIASGVYFHDKFTGEFNFNIPVSADLILVAMAGLAAYEAGVYGGWWRAKSGRQSEAEDSRHVYFILVPAFIWILSLVLSVRLFSIQSVPLFSDPMNRRYIGFGYGVLKRFMSVFLPMAAIEIYAIYIKTKHYKMLTWLAVVGTLFIFFLWTFKGPLFFFIIYLLIVRYLLLGDRMRSWRKILFNRKNLGLIVLGIFIVLIYEKYALHSSFLNIMLVRSTNLIAKSPNYIIGGYPGVPGSEEVLKSDFAGIMRTFRVPTEWESRTLDTEITSVILGRDVSAGGLNPTVLGYGWILGKWVGVVLLSLLYGLMSGRVLKKMVFAKRPQKIATFIFIFFFISGCVQIFSPIGSLLDIGLSILGYCIFHKMLEVVFSLPIITSVAQA